MTNALRSSSRRRNVWLIVSGVAILAAGWFGWRWYALSQRPNVLLITLDTTRSDRIGCYGYEQAQTPALDALAASGVLFERAYTTAPLTLPAHASLMTGLYPAEHRLITNGRGRLDAGIPTLAQTLHDAGYDTAAFVGSFVLHSKFGLKQGFDVYDDDMTHTDPTEHGLHRQRDGQRVIDRALQWLTQPRRKPFFCWVHLYDPHHPYVAHTDEFGDKFQDRPYDAELAYVDGQLGRLVEHLDQSQLRPKTMIVVVGDHGESLGEHDEAEHSLTLYDATLRVPWIWSGRGVPAAGRRVAATVSLADLAPTILDALGQKALPQISGRSLRPALEGRDVAGRDCYSASDDPLFELGCSPVRSLATAQWKYIRSTEPELYDLAADPHELQNLAAEQPDQLAELEYRLADLERAMTPRKDAGVELSPQEQRALESLGYLGGAGGAQSSADGASLPDVKRVLPLSNEVLKIHALVGDGKLAEAEEQARSLVSRAPEFLDASLVLVESLLPQSKFRDCDAVLTQAMQLAPEDDRVYFFRGLLETAQNRREAAIEQFQAALRIKPNAEGSLFNLANTLLQVGRHEEAQRYFEELLEVDPAHSNAHVGLGMICAARQSPAEALAHYRSALDYNAGSVEAHSNLGVLLAKMQRIDEAGEHLSQAAQLAPNGVDARFNFGAFLLATGRPAEAAAEFSATLSLAPNHPHAARLLKQAQSMTPR